MENKLAKKVTINLDRSRNMLLNMNSMIEFENATGQDFMEFTKRIQRRSLAYMCKAAPENAAKAEASAKIHEGDQALQDKYLKLAKSYREMPEPVAADLALPDLSMKEMRAMLWCLLIHEDESLTLKQVGSMIRADNMEDVFKAMILAQQVNAPESDEKPTENGAACPLEGAPQQ